MIRVLPPEVVGKIAAGEVVERPFSVVKELVENSIDAGATRIIVELEDGGRSLVRVTDDGRGMSVADLELAFVQHATSKLEDVGDLDAIVSLGFRGEALASIGAVSRARILSREANAIEGAEVRAEGGVVTEVRPAAAAQGTVIEIRDLFCNVPARRRFLKTPQGERQRCLEVLQKLALSHPDVGFRIEAGRTIDLPPRETLRRRIGRLFGRQTEARALAVQHERGGVGVDGLVVDPDGARRDRAQQHLFVNGRPIRDRSLSHAVEDAYREYLMGGRFPVVFLFITLDPAKVDVNVHPTKSEVRFVEGRLVYSAVRSAVIEALAQRAGRVAERGAGAVGAVQPMTGFPELPRGLFGQSEGIGASFGKLAALPRSQSEPPLGAPLPLSPFQGVSCFLVLQDLYILLETDAGFAIVDQHALHERVVYEKLLAAYRAGNVAVQRLLVPAVVELPPADKDLLLEHVDALRATGLLIADFGGVAVQLEGYPAPLRRPDPEALIGGLVRELREVGDVGEPEALHERLHSRACRSAVMAGDKLADAEIEELLKAAAKLEHPHNCPHGRPTVVSFTTGQLERWFKRRV